MDASSQHNLSGVPSLCRLVLQQHLQRSHCRCASHYSAYRVPRIPCAASSQLYSRPGRARAECTAYAELCLGHCAAHASPGCKDVLLGKIMFINVKTPPVYST